MKSVYDLSLELNSVSINSPCYNSIRIGSILDTFSILKKGFLGGKIEVVMTENDFSKIGAFVTGALKRLNVETALLLIEENDFHYTAVRKSFSNNISAVIAVGDTNLLSLTRYYSSINGVLCYAVPTTPYIEPLTLSNVYLKTTGLPATLQAQAFNKIFIDENIILKAENSYFAKSYVSVMSKLTALIDYKVDCFLSGNKVDGEVFSLSKKAINTLAKISLYKNYKSAILGAQIFMLMVNYKEPFIGSGVEVVKNCLFIFNNKSLCGDKTLIAFEKTAKIYHMYFSNDFSDLLSVPDYEGDLVALEQSAGYERAHFYKNLKIPSEKRRKLINILMEKTRADFKKETSVILSVLPNVIKIYNQLNNNKEKNFSYKQIKNAVTLGAYLTDKTSVLTLCRDAGILKCAN